MGGYHATYMRELMQVGTDCGFELMQYKSLSFCSDKQFALNMKHSCYLRLSILVRGWVERMVRFEWPNRTITLVSGLIVCSWREVWLWFSRSETGLDEVAGKPVDGAGLLLGITCVTFPQAYCSISRPAMSLKDHTDLAYAMNTISLHSQFVDDLDEVISIPRTVYFILLTWIFKKHACLKCTFL